MNLKDLGKRIKDKRIKDKRIELNMTQEELAKKSGYTSRSSINKIELGLVDLPQSKITLIAQALDVQASYLIEGVSIGDRIKSRRIALGLSVDELALKIGKNRATVYRYENNGIDKFSTAMLEKISLALGVTPAYLMGWEETATVQASLLTEQEKAERQERLDLYAHVLRGLINYHKRMMMGGGCYSCDHGNATLCKTAEANKGECPTVTVKNDCYLGALEESLKLIEQEIASL